MSADAKQPSAPAAPPAAPPNPPQVQQFRTKDLPKTGVIAYREAMGHFQRTTNEIVEAAREDLGLKPQEGEEPWVFDPDTTKFRQRVTEPPKK